MLTNSDIIAITFSLIGASAACLVAIYVYRKYNDAYNDTYKSKNDVVESMYEGLID